MSGNFEFVDWLNSDVKTYPVAESLTPSDWLTLAKRAISAFKFYDSAIDFVRQGLDTSPKRSKQLAKFQSLAKNLAQFNNNMLTKTGKVVGFNYSITPDLLTPDLKVNNTPVEYQILDGTKNVLDHHFRKVCHEGSYLVNYKPIEHCKWLHHNDPYLKLGPFKTEVVRQRPYLSVFRDILTEAEMKWLVDYSSPRLSRTRYCV